LKGIVGKLGFQKDQEMVSNNPPSSSLGLDIAAGSH